MSQPLAPFRKDGFAGSIPATLLGISVVLSAAPPAWSVIQCNEVPNGYSVKKAAGFTRLAYDAIERCRTAPKAQSGLPCREAYWHLREADVNLAQVWAQTADSTNGCWICDNSYLVGEARALSKLVNWFNEIVRIDGRYWLSGANKTIEGLNTGWSDAPLCRRAGSAAPWVDGNQSVYDPSAVVEANDRCSVSYTTDTGRAPRHSDFSTNKCYLLFRERGSNFKDVIVHLNPYGTAPSTHPEGFRRSNGGVCTDILKQVRSMCGF